MLLTPQLSDILSNIPPHPSTSLAVSLDTLKYFLYSSPNIFRWSTVDRVARRWRARQVGVSSSQQGVLATLSTPSTSHGQTGQQHITTYQHRSVTILVTILVTRQYDNIVCSNSFSHRLKHFT